MPTLDQQQEENAILHERRLSRFDGIAITTGAIGAVAVLYLICKDVIPFLPVAAIFILLFPFRQYKAARSILFTVGSLFIFWLVVSLSGLLFSFVVGMLLAYIFNPLVTTLHKRWKISRALSSIVIVLLLVAVCGFTGWLIVPVMIDQIASLIEVGSHYIQNNAATLNEQGLTKFLVSLGVPKSYATSFLNDQLFPALKNFASSTPGMAMSLVSAIPTVMTRVLDVVMIPLVTIYFLKDWESIGTSLLGLIPPKNHPHWKITFKNIDHILYGFIRGQSLVAAIIGTISGLGLWIAGIPYAGLLGLMIGIMDLVPTIGLILSIVFVELVIIVTMPITASNILLGIFIIIGLHLIETYYLGPKIVGKGVGIPPLLIIMSIFIFGYFMGILGMFLAVPLTGIILLFIREYRQALVTNPSTQ